MRGVGNGETGLGRGVWGGEPGVVEQGGEGGPLAGLHPEALADEILALGGHTVAKPQLGHADLLI